MKKLLIVTSSNFPYGSASANLLRLMGAGLTEQGWTVEVLLQRGLDPGGKQTMPPRTGVERGVSYRFCGWRIRPRNLLLKPLDTLCGNISAVAGIIRRRTDERVDTVLLYNSSGFENAVILLLCKVLRIKAVAYISEWYEKASIVRRWYHLPLWWDFLFRMKAVNPRFDGLVMPSRFLFNYYKDQKHLPESRLYLLPNLVELAYFETAAADTEFPKRGVRIGYCGTPTRKDGAEDLIRAFAEVQKKESGTELMIIGDQPGISGLLKALKADTEALGVAERVVFTGRVPFQRMPGLLHSCDILALARPAGVFAEAGFPTKLGEYMACRKPVVVTRVGDIPGYLTHRENAMLAEPDRPADFAEQILWLIRHPSEAGQIAERGRCWAAEVLGYQKAVAIFSGFLQPDK